MFKKFSLWSAAMLFTFSVFCLITIGSLSVLLRPNYLKSWGTKSGTYQKLPDALVNQAAKEQAADKTKAPGADDDALSFEDKGVQDAAKAALTPAFVQKSAEQIIDGSFMWLDQKSNKPTFSIDLLPVKQDFVDNLGVFLKQRYQSLPACSRGSIPSTTDLQKIDCRPSEELFDIDKAIDAQKLELLGSKEFLAENTITPDTASNDETAFDNKTVPNLYRVFTLAPFIFGVLALVSGALVIALCQSKKFGVRKLGWRFIVAGVLALIATAVGIIALSKVGNLALHQSADSGITPFKDIVVALINAARSDVGKVSGILSLGAVVIGAVILLLTRDVSRKAVAARHNSEHKTTRDSDTDEAPSKKREEVLVATDSPVTTPGTAPVLPTATAKSRPPKKPLIQ